MTQVLLNLIPTILSIIIIWYLTKFIFNRINYFKNKKLFKNLAIVSVTLIVYFLAIKLILNILISVPKEKFNETTWKSNINERHKMIDDLIESKYIINKDKDKIIEVFGEPKDKIIEDNIWIYELVGRSWSDFKITTLKIHFNDSTAYKTSRF